MMKNRFAGTLKPKSAATDTKSELLPVEVKPPTVPEQRKPGRPKSKDAKKNNPQFVQATLYLRRKTYDELKIEGIKQGKDISDLAEIAIREFLKG